jgi:hypothetical protein
VHTHTRAREYMRVLGHSHASTHGHMQIHTYRLGNGGQARPLRKHVGLIRIHVGLARHLLDVSASCSITQGVMREREGGMRERSTHRRTPCSTL